MSEFDTSDCTTAAKHLEGDSWTPPALTPEMPVSDESLRDLSAEWFAMGMKGVRR